MKDKINFKVKIIINRQNSKLNKNSYKIMEMNILLGKKRGNDANYSKTRYQYYKTNHDIRLDHREILEYIKSDMALRNRETNLIENLKKNYNSHKKIKRKNYGICFH